MIQIKNLHKYFNKGKKNELHVLDDITLTFENTGLVCILGESGSGKTTLLNTLGGLDVFSHGEIDYDGEKVKKYEKKKVEKIRNDNFGYIFQNYYLLQDYTVDYNVKLALNTFAISEEEKEQRVEYVLEKLGMARYKKKLVSQLSGGQQQRVSIARALVKSPKIILADEPTGNLDEENTLRTMSVLKNIAKDCLVILVSHEKRIAQFFADRIIEIQDGKIQKDYKNQAKDTYERVDDGNIYLKDREFVPFQKENFIEGKIYGEEGVKEETIRLNFAWKNGKLYIQNLGEYDVVFEGQEAGCEMLDKHKPVIEQKNIDDFEFSLPELKRYKTATLTPQEIGKMAIENLRIMGKKQAFIVGILLATAIMITVAMANFTNSRFYNKYDVIKSDRHIVSVMASPGEDMWKQEDFDEAFRDFCNNSIFESENYYKTGGEELDLKYNGFHQLMAAEAGFKDFSYASVNEVKKEDIILGRMAKKRNEIVMDRWVLDSFLQSDDPMTSVLPSIKAYLNQQVVSSITGDTFRIVGICDKGNPTVYMDQYSAIGLSANSSQIADVKQLQEQFPGKYDDLELKEDQVLLSESQYKRVQMGKLKTITMKNGCEYKVMGSYPDSFSVKYVLNKDVCDDFVKDCIIESKSFDIYTTQPKRVMEKIKKAGEEYAGTMILSVFCDRDNQLQKYEKSHRESNYGKNLIMVAAVLVVLFMLYFMIKSNVSARMEELTVYRLIGIGKRSIQKAYLLEMFLITSYTVLPAVLITTGIIKYIGGIPSLGLTLYFPWWVAICIIGAMYLLNLLISIMPVNRILSQPPAVLAAKK